MQITTDSTAGKTAPLASVSLILCARDCRPQMEAFIQEMDLEVARALRVQFIFVDLDSHDGTPELIEAFQRDAGIPVELLYDAQSCISRSRNLALEVISGEIVGFLDDPSAFSLEALRAGIKACVDDKLDYALLGNQPDKALAPGAFVPARLGQNSILFARQSVIQALDGFDSRYSSDPDFEADNLDFALRASLNGYCGAAIRLSKAAQPVPETAAESRHLISAGAVYLSHFLQPRPGSDRRWASEWSRQEGASRWTECRGALRSLWQSELLQHQVRRPLFRLRNPREFQAYGIGTSKSGTHTLRSLTIGSFWSEHEPEDRELIQRIIAFESGAWSRVEMIEYIRRRDQRMYLEMDASNLNIHLAELLCEIFPRARFILTVRDCLSWVDSEINHRLGRPYPRAWKTMWNHRYQADRLRHSPEEQPLADLGLHTLDGYLSYWTWHNSAAIARIPAEQLLLIKTKDLSHAAPQIADFLEIPISKLDTRFHHSFAASKKYGVLSQLDPAFVQAKANQHCGEVMRKMFPEIPLPLATSAKA